MKREKKWRAVYGLTCNFVSRAGWLLDSLTLSNLIYFNFPGFIEAKHNFPVLETKPENTRAPKPAKEDK